MTISCIHLFLVPPILHGLLNLEVTLTMDLVAWVILRLTDTYTVPLVRIKNCLSQDRLKSSASFPWDDGIAVLGGTPWFQNTLKGIADMSITRFALSAIQFVGIKENGNIGNNVYVYPNPTNTSINVKIDDFKKNITIKSITIWGS